MLEDPGIQAAGLLKWAEDGQGFVCPDPSEFARWVSGGWNRVGVEEEIYRVTKS